jgi:hypothetical protein
MTTRRVLCGWVNFNERVASHDALQAMLGAEGLSLGDVQIQASETGVIACTHIVSHASGITSDAPRSYSDARAGLTPR